jgi:iron complex transport system ATP-binding protein
MSTFRQPADQSPRSSSHLQAGSPPLLAFEHVTVERNGRIALDDVTLSIGPKEHVAIVGPNGSGKSTFIKTITRELYPRVRPESAVRLLGRERWNVTELRAHLGLVSNDLVATCTRELTGREVVLSGFFSSIGLWPHHLITPAMEDTAASALARLDVPHLAARFVNEMSSGEAKRVLIARALVHNPDTLLFDEPSNSLDFQAQHELRTTFQKLARGGTGLLLVTHHLPDIVPEIERVLLLKDGRVFRDGAKDELLTSDTLSELFNLRVEVVRRDGYFHLL